MAEFVPKSQLIRLIDRIINEQATGLLSVLTDTRRSVLLRFSEGKLIHSYCRTKDVGDAIHVLNDCGGVKFTFAPSSVEHKPELMPGGSFVSLLDPGAGADAARRRPIPIDAPRGVRPGPDGDSDAQLKDALVAVAADYVGMIAETVVEEAMQDTADVGQAIEYIADLIPDASQAAAFRASARERIPLVPF